MEWEGGQAGTDRRSGRDVSGRQDHRGRNGHDNVPTASGLCSAGSVGSVSGPGVLSGWWRATPAIAGGYLTKVASGVGSLVGLASGLILGSLIMYYLLKDGSQFRRSVVA
jgi:hypothetical protein